MLSRIKGILKRRGYKIFSRPNELNIVGLRSKNTKANKFDDEIHVFYKTGNRKWDYFIFKATTDPGTFWLKNPSAPQGTAILKEGQYKNAYKLGLHRGKYKALVQTAPVIVMRDYDRNEVLNFKSGKIYKGNFGINIHHAKSNGKTYSIDEYSAGCQVFQSKEEFDLFLTLCEEHEKRYGNSFTYTLIDFRAVRRITIKRVIMAASLIATTIASLVMQGGKR